MRDSGVCPVKIVSETTRERETFRYEPSLRADYRFNSDGGVFPASEVATASDSVLTGLAQLGTYQTKTDRAFISLFDSSHQYVIAEAAPSIRITPRLSSDSCPVPLSLCGTAIPRHQGTCEHVLFLPTNPQSASELPISLVQNLAADDRFSSRPYCQFGETGQFYAAVPIRTRKGINIGAYCVMNPTPPEGWDDECTHRLQDISQAVMEHMEFKRSKAAVRGHERMNRGLGSFIEGKGTLWGWQSGPNHDAFVDNAHLEGSLNVKQQLLERQQEVTEEDEQASWIERLTSQMGVATLVPNHTSVEGSTATPDPVVVDSSYKADAHRMGYSQPTSRASSDQGDDLYTNVGGASRIFSKAANIIRESFEVEGCVFLDVTLGSYRQPTDHKSPGTGFRDEPGEASSTSSSDEHTNISTDTPGPRDIIGFATTDASSINGNKLINGNIGTIPKRFLAKLLRRYPNGKIFNFDGYGELQPSDSSEDDSSVVTPSLDAEPSSSRACMDSAHSIVSEKEPQDGQYSRLREGSLIHQAFLSARSVAFIPVWDPKRERWVAGGFIYTLTPTRVFSVERELSFLTAFARLVAAELVNLEMLQVDRAKSDTLGSLSHELRSPLHGVILGTELLNDTKLTVFQGTTTHMIETSCRTLLDTIDHLLDYSKVNSFITEQKKVPKSQKRARANQLSKKNLSQDIRLDSIIEEVSESVFAGFSFQRMSVRQLSRQHKPGFTDDAAHRRMDFAQAVEQFAISSAAEGHRFGNDDIAVYLSIDPLCDWMFRAQPGAIRRIFMNLFGNSLKYSTTGTIQVTLTQEALVSRRPTPGRLVKLTVQDTGRGMSEDYLRHKLFKPFAQEDELMTGTGLGLSLVKKIVTQLGGEIRVHSQVEIGTIVTVALPLEQSPQTSNMPLEMREDEKQFKKQLQELKGLRVRVCGFEPNGTGGGSAIVSHICRQWLQLELVSDEERNPDIVLRSEDTLPESFEEIAQLAKIPNVVICQDALAAYRLLTRYENVGQGGILEFVSQPIGPRILAKSLVFAYKKWTGLPNFLALPRPRGPVRAHSLHIERLTTKATSLEASWEALSTSQPDISELLPTMSSDGNPTEARVGPTPCYQTPDAPVPAKLERSAAGRMLLVDDNQINLRILAAYLSKLGIEYELATNGEEAINAYTRQTGHFVGILMDISMPIMDGLEATRQIRAHERKHQLDAAAIIALTGLASDSTRQEALDSGVVRRNNTTKQRVKDGGDSCN